MSSSTPDWSGLRHRLTQVPALRGEAVDEAGAVRNRMLPVFAAAHAGGHAVVTCWVRSRAHGPVSVLVGGPFTPAAAPSGRGEVPIAFPGGSRARSVRGDDVDKLLQRITHWAPADLSLDATRLDDDRAPGPVLEDLFGTVADRPMAVLVHARPLTEDQARARLDVLSDRVDQLEAHRKGRGSERQRLARAEAELDHLEAWSTQGCWELAVWTGGAGTDGAAAVAGMLAGGGDLAGTALRVRPASTTDVLQRDWAPRCVVGADAVASLARSPGRELSGVRAVATPDFDLNVEQPGGVDLGWVLDPTRTAGGPFSVSLDSLNRHAFVTGATGSGKSHTVRTMLQRLTLVGVPWLVIEPAKAEYAALADRIGTPLVVIRPGDPTAAPASLNPLEPSSIVVGGVRHQFPLQTHLDLVRALFTAAFEAEEPFPQILASALTRSYEDLGWNLAVGRALDGADDAPPRWPALSDLQRHAFDVIDAVGYGADVRDNVRGFVGVRIDSLRLGTPGRFFEGGHPLDLEGLLDGPAVFEIEDLGDDKDKAFFIGTVIIRLFELLRLRLAAGVPVDGLRHVLVIEEAHRLLRHAQEGSSAAHSVAIFANLLAEVRSYGQGLIVAEQIPSKLLSDVVKNSAVKVLHRLPSADDRELVGATMNLSDEQSAHVVALAPGEAAVHTDGMDRPVLVAVDPGGAPVPGGGRGTIPLAVRSVTCPAACAGAPCTLEELEVSRHLPDRDALRLWVEVVVIAHLTGGKVGTPAGGWFDRLRSADRHRVTCALGLAIDDSVDRRSAVIRASYDPQRLKVRLRDLLAKQLDTGRGLGVVPVEWRIGHHRVVDVTGALRAAPAPGQDPTQPHPDTAAWAALGLRLPGPSWAEQLEQAYDAASVLQVDDVRTFEGHPGVLRELSSRHPADDAAHRLGGSIQRLGLEPGRIARSLARIWGDAT